VRILLVAIISGIIISVVLALISIYLVTYMLFRAPTNYASNVIVVSDASRTLVRMKSDLNNISYYYPFSNVTEKQTPNSLQPIVIYNPVIITNSSNVYVIIGIEKSNDTLYILEQKEYYKIDFVKLNETEKYVYYNITLNFVFKPKSVTILFIPIWDSKHKFSTYIVVILQPGTISSSRS